MAKNGLALKDALKQRAGENLPNDNSEAIDSSYQFLFGVPERKQTITYLPIDKLVDFFTAKLHFRDLTSDELWALAESIENIGLQDEPIVRPVPDSDKYEIIAGMHRRKAHQIKGWKTVRVKIIEATDAQAILIATDTNLKRRQKLLPSEKGFAYRLQLETMKHQGKQIVLPETSVSLQQKSAMTTREKVAEIYGVKASDIQRYIRLTYLMPPLLEAVDEQALPIEAGIAISYYDEPTQEAIYNICFVERIKSLDVKMAEHLKETCPPPHANAEDIRKILLPATAQAKPSKVISFKRSKFTPYLAKIPDEGQLEQLFLEFLHERFGEK